MIELRACHSGWLHFTATAPVHSSQGFCFLGKSLPVLLNGHFQLYPHV